MDDRFTIPVSIRPLHVEVDGVGKYRVAFSVDDLAALLLGGGWPRDGQDAVNFPKDTAAVFVVEE